MENSENLQRVDETGPPPPLGSCQDEEDHKKSVGGTPEEGEGALEMVGPSEGTTLDETLLSPPVHDQDASTQIQEPEAAKYEGVVVVCSTPTPPPPSCLSETSNAPSPLTQHEGETPETHNSTSTEGFPVSSKGKKKHNPKSASLELHILISTQQVQPGPDLAYCDVGGYRYFGDITAEGRISRRELPPDALPFTPSEFLTHCYYLAQVSPVPDNVNDLVFVQGAALSSYKIPKSLLLNLSATSSRPGHYSIFETPTILNSTRARHRPQKYSDLPEPTTKKGLPNTGDDSPLPADTLKPRSKRAGIDKEVPAHEGDALHVESNFLESPSLQEKPSLKKHGAKHGSVSPALPHPLVPSPVIKPPKTSPTVPQGKRREKPLVPKLGVPGPHQGKGKPLISSSKPVLKGKLPLSRSVAREPVRKSFSETHAEGENGPLSCPLPPCTKSFFNLKSLRVHLFRGHGQRLSECVEYQGEMSSKVVIPAKLSSSKPAKAPSKKIREAAKQKFQTSRWRPDAQYLEQQNNLFLRLFSICFPSNEGELVAGLPPLTTALVLPSNEDPLDASLIIVPVSLPADFVPQFHCNDDVGEAFSKEAPPGRKATPRTSLSSELVEYEGQESSTTLILDPGNSEFSLASKHASQTRTDDKAIKKVPSKLQFANASVKNIKLKVSPIHGKKSGSPIKPVKRVVKKASGMNASVRGGSKSLPNALLTSEVSTTTGSLELQGKEVQVEPTASPVRKSLANKLKINSRKRPLPPPALRRKVAPALKDVEVVVEGALDGSPETVMIAKSLPSGLNSSSSSSELLEQSVLVMGSEGVPENKLAFSSSSSSTSKRRPAPASLITRAPKSVVGKKPRPRSQNSNERPKTASPPPPQLPMVTSFETVSPSGTDSENKIPAVLTSPPGPVVGHLHSTQAPLTNSKTPKAFTSFPSDVHPQFRPALPKVNTIPPTTLPPPSSSQFSPLPESVISQLYPDRGYPSTASSVVEKLLSKQLSLLCAAPSLLQMSNQGSHLSGPAPTSQPIAHQVMSQYKNLLSLQQNQRNLLIVMLAAEPSPPTEELLIAYGKVSNEINSLVDLPDPWLPPPSLPSSSGPPLSSTTSPCPPSPSKIPPPLSSTSPPLSSTSPPLSDPLNEPISLSLPKPLSFQPSHMPSQTHPGESNPDANFPFIPAGQTIAQEDNDTDCPVLPPCELEISPSIYDQDADEGPCARFNSSFSVNSPSLPKSKRRKVAKESKLRDVVTANQDAIKMGEEDVVDVDVGVSESNTFVALHATSSDEASPMSIKIESQRVNKELSMHPENVRSSSSRGFEQNLQSESGTHLNDLDNNNDTTTTADGFSKDSNPNNRNNSSNRINNGGNQEDTDHSSLDSEVAHLVSRPQDTLRQSSLSPPRGGLDVDDGCRNVALETTPSLEKETSSEPKTASPRCDTHPISSSPNDVVYIDLPRHSSPSPLPKTSPLLGELNLDEARGYFVDSLDPHDGPRGPLQSYSGDPHAFITPVLVEEPSPEGIMIDEHKFHESGSLDGLPYPVQNSMYLNDLEGPDPEHVFLVESDLDRGSSQVRVYDTTLSSDAVDAGSIAIEENRIESCPSDRCPEIHSDVMQSSPGRTDDPPSQEVNQADPELLILLPSDLENKQIPHSHPSSSVPVDGTYTSESPSVQETVVRLSPPRDVPSPSSIRCSPILNVPSNSEACRSASTRLESSSVPRKEIFLENCDLNLSPSAHDSSNINLKCPPDSIERPAPPVPDSDPDIQPMVDHSHPPETEDDHVITNLLISKDEQDLQKMEMEPADPDVTENEAPMLDNAETHKLEDAMIDQHALLLPKGDLVAEETQGFNVASGEGVVNTGLKPDEKNVPFGGSYDFSADLYAPRVQLRTSRTTKYMGSLGHTKVDPLTLVKCEKFSINRMTQPFEIRIAATAIFIMDLHSHLSTTEIIGYLAGTFDHEAKILTIAQAFPCSAIEGDDGEHADRARTVEMDPMSEIRARELIAERGLSIVGWYHSHPIFRPDPSIRDIENQQHFQHMFENDGAPFVGLIVAPYDPLVPEEDSVVRCFWVQQSRNSVGTPMDAVFSKQESDANLPWLLETLAIICYYERYPDRTSLETTWKRDVSNKRKIIGSLKSKLPSSLSDAQKEGFMEVLDTILDLSEKINQNARRMIESA